MKVKRVHSEMRVRLCALVAVLVLVASSLSQAQDVQRLPQRILFEPFEMRENFQGDGLGQWASYPPVQDIGYEPSLSPTSGYGAPGGRALMRVIRVNRDGMLRFGFIKRVRTTLTSNSRLRFSYRLNSLSTATLEIGLAGVDGHLYTTSLVAKANQWVAADLTLDDLRAPPGTGLEAIYIVASVQAADPDFTYRFIIDDVALSAVRAAKFDVEIPRSELIEPWPALVSSKSYRARETISFAARAPLTLKSVEVLLATQTGNTIASDRLYDDGSHGDRIAGDGIWTNDKLYEVGASDPPGLWLATVRGTGGGNELVVTDVRLLIRSSGESIHPRLFFSATEREKLIARSRDPKLSSLWSYLQATAKTARESGELANGGDVIELLDSQYLLPSLPGYFDVLNRARTRIAYNAFDAYITGSVEARNAAKSALLDVARWKHWAPPWFRAHGQQTYYPAGQLAADVAFGYDLLYDDLSDSERILIRNALLEKSIIPTFKEYVVDNRVMANTSNWIAHTVGGALIAAASIAGDKTEVDGNFEVYVGGLLRKLEDHLAASYLADGSYGEGISYQEFDAETLGPALIAVQRAFGIDYWKQSHVLESLSYPLYLLAHPVSASPDMGDTHPPAGHGIAPFVYQAKDPVVRWYFSQFDRPSIPSFIFHDDVIAAKPPNLPTSKIFRDRGYAVFRSGWTSDDIVFLFRAGPNFNHHHADQGSFLLTAFGEVLISEAGWSDYYKDPYYATFFTQAAGHNTVLVDHDPESQTIPDTPQFKALDSYPRITDSLTSDFYDSVTSDLSSVYQKHLASYERSIVFMKPDYFVVFDKLKTEREPMLFEFLLHLVNRDRIKLDGLSAIYQGEKASLAVRSFPSCDAKLSVENGRVPYQVFATRTPSEIPAPPAYLDLKIAKPVSEMQFLTAIVPARTAGAAQTLLRRMSELSGSNIKGLRVERGKKTELIVFRSGSDAEPIRQGEWSADASMLIITENANGLEQYGIQRGRSLRRRNQVLFSSDAAVSVAVRFAADEIEVTANADATTSITLFVGKNPIMVKLDNQEHVFKNNQGTISLTIPGGQHFLKITNDRA